MDEQDIKIYRIYKVNGDSKLRAFVDIALSGFVIKGLRIVNGQKGLFLAMPRHQGKDGKWYNTVYAASKEIHRELTEAALAAYNS